MTRRELLAALPGAAAAQQADIRSTVRLVLVPASVRGRDGQPIDGLEESHFRLSVDGTSVRFQLEEERQPLSLAIVVQNSASSGPVIAKLQEVAGMIQPLIAGEGGICTVIAFSDRVSVVQPPTRATAPVDLAFRQMRLRGHGARILDAVNQAVELLESTPSRHRRVILLLSEGRDHGSETPAEQVLERLQKANVTLSGLLYSPFLTTWTVKPGQRVGREDDADSMPALQQGGMDLIPLIVGAATAGKLATAKMLAQFTGGLALSFARKDSLERVIAQTGEDLHSQYLLTFQDTAPADGQIHQIRVEAAIPGAKVRARQGFWRGSAMQEPESK